MARINWSRYTSDTKMISLYGNRIAEMNWKDAPNGLLEIDLSNNEIAEMIWEGAPIGLQWISLDGNQITEMNWEGVPEDVEIFPRKLNDLKNKFMKHIKFMKYIKFMEYIQFMEYKAKLPKPITHRIKHLSLVSTKNIRYKMVKKTLRKIVPRNNGEGIGISPGTLNTKKTKKYKKKIQKLKNTKKNTCKYMCFFWFYPGYNKRYMVKN